MYTERARSLCSPTPRQCLPRLVALAAMCVQVIVIKPPLTFGKVHVGRFVNALRQELRALNDADLSKVTHTPT